MDIQTGRDPFARETIDKYRTDGECDWCGGRNGHGGVFIYTVERDGLRTRPEPIKGQFCCVDCLNSYHG